MPGNQNPITFPETQEDAAKRFEKCEHHDPFANEIPPALLNSRDISEYVRVAGIVHPFDRGNGKLKSASYEIGFTGTIYYWKDDNKESFEAEPIVFGKRFKIPKNSIVFVSPETTFRLPDYIALRFNLRIRHVHRGLILGTGPLVDPGFVGRLFIPIHNLTSEPYSITGGEGLIWVEFTKISPHPHWVDGVADCEGYKHFSPEHRNMTPQQYMDKASGGEPARSSIPLEIAQAIDTSSLAMKRVRAITIGGVIAAIFAAIGAVYPIISLVQDSNKFVRESRETNDGAERKIIGLNSDISNLKERIAILEAENKKIIAAESSSSNRFSSRHSNCIPAPKMGCQQNCTPECSSK